MHLPCLVHHLRGKCPPIFTQMLPLLSLPELELTHFVFVFLEPTFLQHHILIDPCDVHLLDQLLYFTSLLLLICYCVRCYQARSVLMQSALPESGRSSDYSNIVPRALCLGARLQSLVQGALLFLVRWRRPWPRGTSFILSFILV